MNLSPIFQIIIIVVVSLAGSGCGGGSYGTGTRPVQLTDGSEITPSQNYSLLGFAEQCRLNSGYSISVADQSGQISTTLLKTERGNGAKEYRCLAHVSGKQENLRVRISPVHDLSDSLRYSVGAEACDGSTVPLPWSNDEGSITFQSGFITLPSLHGTTVQRLRIYLWFDYESAVELVLENDDLNCLKRKN